MHKSIKQLAGLINLVKALMDPSHKTGVGAKMDEALNYRHSVTAIR
jgi:hypothetical protein